MNRFYILAFFLLTGKFLFAQEIKISSKDSVIFENYKEKVTTERWDTLQFNELVTNTGVFFLETPYVNYTLEINDTEQLVVNFDELDCTTFAEVSLALARAAVSENFSLSNFCKELQNIRYRGGILTDYTSRLHYFSDWIYDNQQMGLVEDITKKIGGYLKPTTVYIMSKRYEKYKALQENPDFIPTILEQEAEINNREHYFIPKAEVDSFAYHIQSGDIIAITTAYAGLDITHLGFACWQNDELHLMHASREFQQVIITPNTMKEYLLSNTGQGGIMVARVMKP